MGSNRENNKKKPPRIEHMAGLFLEIFDDMDYAVKRFEKIKEDISKGKIIDRFSEKRINVNDKKKIPEAVKGTKYEIFFS